MNYEGDPLPENQRDEDYVEDQERGKRAGFHEGSFWREL